MACDLTAWRDELHGGEIGRTDAWVVEHCVGPLGVGTLIIKPVRHCVGLWDSTDDEAADLGPVMR